MSCILFLRVISVLEATFKQLRAFISSCSLSSASFLRQHPRLLS
jgi:hypothetical protein